MSEFQTEFIEFLKVLADKTRLEILNLLREEKKSSSQIQTALEKAQSTISQHLKVLSSKNLIVFDKINNIKAYSVRNQDIFKLLVEIKSYVAQINQEKLKDLRDLDVIDTLS